MDDNAPLGIRELTADDVQAYYALRLAALESHPEAFGASVEDWKQRSLDEVRRQLHDNHASDNKCVLGAFCEGALVGTVGLFRESLAKVRHKATVVGVYVAPQKRGQGIAGRLLDELVRRAKDMPGLEQLQLLVVTSNRAAVKLYESRGFKVFGVERHTLCVDGACYDGAHMQLFL